MKSVIANYEYILMLWEECETWSMAPDARARILGVRSQMQSFNFFYGKKSLNCKVKFIL